MVLDSQLRTPASAKVVSDGAPTLLVHNPGIEPPVYLQEAIAVSFYAPPGGTADLHNLLQHLAEVGCNEVLVEAGASVCGSFAQADLWDEWLAYVAPKLLGDDTRQIVQMQVATLAAAPRGSVKSVRRVGPDVRICLTRKQE